MPTIISGMSGITDVNANQLIIDVSKKMWLLKPSIAPFNVLLQKLPKRRVDSIEFRLFEDEKLPEWDTVKADYLVDATAITVDHIEYFQAGDLILNAKTQERMYVRSLSGTDTLNVTREWGYSAGSPPEGFPKVAGTAADKILIVSNALPEKGEKGGDSKITKKEMVYNRTQKIHTIIELSNEELKHKMYGEDRRKYETKKMGIEQIEKIEKAFWFGTGAYVDQLLADGTTKRIATCDGVLSILAKSAKSNYLKLAGLTEAIWDKDVLPVVFAYGDRDNKVCFASAMLISLLTSFAKDKLVVDNQRSKEYGIEIWNYRSPFGMLKMVYHPLFINDYRDLAVVVDMDCVEYVYFADEDNKLITNLQNKEKETVGGIRDMYFGHCAPFLANSLNHTVMRLEEAA